MFDFKFFKDAFKEESVSGIRDFFIAGTDEVGRGPLAGPVVAASVSLHFEIYEEKELRLLLKKWKALGINDSKKLSSVKRTEVLSFFPFEDSQMTVDQIYIHRYSNNMCLKVLIKEIPPRTIDEINILNASLKAMSEAVAGSCDFGKRGLVLIDGNKKFFTDSTTVELVPVIKGDSKSLIIGVASIIAKVYRDQLMANYCKLYPGYYWSSNAGYGTAKHLEAISLLGVTEIHRKTFGGVKHFYEEGK